ncbi:HMP-PP hydrolase (pyridoxal phosphatase) Cof [Photobacterium aphoticum]|uniref:HMP-PP hydrolase (Pyridoxal phosphatase) Cof n=1 Tax=Photobacterium aphoticum TaxID=754436 RepID=A0A090QLM9_9GAMM|nr:HMP-PP hydrolase (pyridoxal phosphatase) Cof [Photobacterium aphoticum]
MKQAELAGILAFLNGAEQLKQTLRSAHTSNGRQESTAEHTWRLCLMVMLFEKQFSDIDMLKLLKMCIIHDLGEAISGDIAAVDQIEGHDKGAQERTDLLQLMAPLPQDLQDEILLLWDEYEHASSPEAMMQKPLISWKPCYSTRKA